MNARQLSLWIATLCACSVLSAQVRTPHVADQDAIRGVLVIASSGEPVAGHPVRLRGGGIEPLTGRTAADGSFSFPRVPIERGFLSVAVDPAPGLRFEDDDAPVPADGSALRLLARVTPTAPLHGRALERESGAPLGHSWVRIFELGGPSEVCRTDGAGLFTSQVEFASARLNVYCWDNESSGSSSNGHHASLRFSVEAARAEGAAPVDCRMVVGERFELELPADAEEHLDDCTLLLRLRGTPVGTPPRFTEARGLLHLEPTPWVRFDPPRGGTLERERFELWILADDGRWAARGALPEAGASRVRLRSVPVGALSIGLSCSVPIEPRVVEHEGERYEFDPPQLARGVRLELEPLGELRGRRPQTRSLDFGAGSLAPWIEPGEWRVRTRSAYFPASEQSVLVLPGALLPVEFVLDPPHELGQLTVRVIDERGDIEVGQDEIGGLMLGARVRSLAPEGRSFAIENWAFCGTGIDGWFARVERGGRHVLEATLRDVPRGEYRVELSCDQRAFAPAALRLNTGELASFTLIDSRPDERYGFEVVDSDSGQRVRGYQVHPGREGQLSPFLRSPGSSGVAAHRLPPGTALDWRIEARGYQPASGGASAFAMSERGHWARVELAPLVD